MAATDIASEIETGSPKRTGRRFRVTPSLHQLISLPPTLAEMRAAPKTYLAGKTSPRGDHDEKVAVKLVQQKFPAVENPGTCPACKPAPKLKITFGALTMVDATLHRNVEFFCLSCGSTTLFQL